MGNKALRYRRHARRSRVRPHLRSAAGRRCRNARAVPAHALRHAIAHEGRRCRASGNDAHEAADGRGAAHRRCSQYRQQAPSTSSITTLRIDLCAGCRLNSSPSSMVFRISPMPNRPMTAIRKSKPFSNSGMPVGHAQLPGHGVEPHRRQAEAQHHRGHGLHRIAPCSCRRRLQNVNRYTAKILGRSELQREARDERRQEGDQDHRHQRTHK